MYWGGLSFFRVQCFSHSSKNKEQTYGVNVCSWGMKDKNRPNMFLTSLFVFSQVPGRIFREQVPVSWPMQGSEVQQWRHVSCWVQEQHSGLHVPLPTGMVRYSTRKLPFRWASKPVPSFEVLCINNQERPQTELKHNNSQVNSANSGTSVPRTPVLTVASAPSLTTSTHVPAHHSSLERPANRTSTSATPTHRLARTAGCASTRSVAIDASVHRSTRASTVRAATCPATRHPALMEEPASRRERPAMNVPVFQVGW